MRQQHVELILQQNGLIVRDTVKQRQRGPTHREIRVVEEAQEDANGILQDMVNRASLSQQTARHISPNKGVVREKTNQQTSSDIVNLMAVIMVQRT